MRRILLVLILLAYFALGVLFAVYTPPWQAPDEPAHYNYVRYLAETGALPVLHFGDYPHGYLEQIKDAEFRGMSIEPIRYEAHQPPLYYALLAPVYSLTDGDLTALRFASVVLGAGILLLAYALGRRIAPGRPALALAAAAFVAFLPQHLATVSQVGNDVLAELLFAAVLYLLAGQVAGEVALPGGQTRRLALLGVLLGLIAITKTTAYIAAPLVGGVLLWRWVQARSSLRLILLDALALILPAALIAAPWFARNAFVYGWPDIFGLIRHDQIVAGQARTAAFIAENGVALYAQRALEFTFKSFWGVFGWLGVFMDSRVYLGLALFSGVVVAGAEIGLRRVRQPRARRVLMLLIVSALLTLLTYIYYNASFVQHQGRYLFTALLPIALAVAWGWDAGLQPRTARMLAAALVLLGAALAVGGLNTGAGLPKWPLVITAGFASALTAASLLPPAWRRVTYAAPFALLPLVALYALFGAIVPQLAR